MWPSHNGTFPLGIPAYWTNWRPSQPDGCCGADVTCAIMNYVGNNGEWDDAGCDQPWAATTGVVCQKNP